jgi:8-oxo-dGTP pyrophosphatase MutT (NUDIX family)
MPHTGLVTHRHLDGDGWIRCGAGHQHWGRHGAAGLLLRCVDTAGASQVLLQRRAWWTHHGGTWGVPGGARASWESPEDAALRELGEEVRIGLDSVTVERIHHDDHGGWSYWTVLATATTPVDAAPASGETAEVRWVASGDVDALELHPGFAATWPHLSYR